MKSSILVIEEKQKELFEKKDSLNSILGNKNQYYLGAFRESLVREFLIDFFDKDQFFQKDKVKVGTGLVINSDNDISKQIDILIYDGTVKEKFKINEFCIVDISQVIACIEVKSNLNKKDLTERNGALNNVKKIRELERKTRKPNDPQIHYTIFSFSSPLQKNIKDNLKSYYQNEFKFLIQEYINEYRVTNDGIPTATRFTPDLILTLEGYSLFFGDQLTNGRMRPSGFISKKEERDFDVIALLYSMLINVISAYFNLFHPEIYKYWKFTNEEIEKGYSNRNIFAFDWENPIILTE